MRFMIWTVILSLPIVTWAWWVMIRMPGRSHSEAAPPLTQQEALLRDSLRRDVEKLAGEIGERNLARYEALTASAAYLEKALAEAGYAVERNPVEAVTPNGPRSAANLIVELKGTQRPEEVVILGAHYDSREGTPGADDNASGTAAVLAL